MAKVSSDPRTYLREAVALSERVLDRPSDHDTAMKLAIKVQALDEAFQHGSFALTRRSRRRRRS